jgi:hypothetical protein
MSENTSKISAITPELYLNSLSSGIPSLTAKKAGVHMEACIWCLLECDHSNGVILTVDEDNVYSKYKICWPEQEINIDDINRAYNKDDGPEQGAEALAFLIIRERTDYTAIRRSTTLTGIDYWLDYKTESQNQLFSTASARLEISGILRQTPTNKLEYRSKKKVEQTKQSDHTSFPVYVVIVEFSQLRSKVIFRNVTH